MFLIQNQLIFPVGIKTTIHPPVTIFFVLDISFLAITIGMSFFDLQDSGIFSIDKSFKMFFPFFINL